jgi:3-hydroxyisobutyrate dehydrogenase
MKVGLIGIGNMGRHYARNLINAGFELHVYSRTSKSLERATSIGAVACKSPKDLASKVKLTLLALPGPKEVEEVTIGDNGIIEGAIKGSLVIDLGTAGVDTVKKVGKELEKKGIDFLDAPVSGGVVGAEKATLTIMVGGKKEVFDRALNVLKVLGKNIYYVGDLGSGNVVKLLNQLMTATNLVAASEAMVLGVKAGINPRLAYEIISKSLGGSAILNYAMPERALKGNFRPGFAIKLMHKDLKLALELAERLNVPLPTCLRAKEMLQIAILSNLADNDMSGVIRVLEDWAKKEVRG